MSLDLFSLVFKNISLTLLRGAIAPIALYEERPQEFG